MEETFQIKYQAGSIPYILDVFPGWDEEAEESRFVVALDAVELGTLRKTESDTWEWYEGGLPTLSVTGVETDFNTAEQIGNLIESHYD